MKNFDELAGAGWPVLTPREREVVYPVAEGKSNKLIAMELGISMRTVEAHRSRIFYKMGVRNAVQLARTVYSQPETATDTADKFNVTDAPDAKESAQHVCDQGECIEDDLDQTINKTDALVESHNWFTPQKRA
jgi:DNA-binding CsgD family transcriptional regulator